MTRPSSPRGSGPARDDDGWGPSTAVYSSSASRAGAPAGNGNGNGAVANPRIGRAFTPQPEPRTQRPARTQQWTPAGPTSAREQRAVRAHDRQERRTAASVEALRQPQAPERGLPAWGALLLLIAIAALGGIIDTLGSIQVKGGFNIGIVVASVIAIIAVKRSHMFPVVIAPPIVYSAAALFQLYVRSSGLHDKKVVLDAAANYLVYGFPAIAAATAAVLIIAGVRLITRK